ncbi:MAG: LPP20 family lipoprotein, partial [Candidatus Symbiothrix sp.]|nr:LPP20 family lipoprotein [Candidatus Symbiothrix sp.]
MNTIKRFCILLVGCLCVQSVFSQTVSEIKSSKQFYYGEGVGKTSTTAEKDALSMLINQISVTVENKFSLLSEQITDNNKQKFAQKVNDVVNTYSNATLKNTEKMEWEDKDGIHILCYIKRSEVSKIFAERESKIKDFTATALKAEENLQVADALKYYYWALLLLQSHPDGNTITYAHNGAEPKLAVFLPQQINAVFSKLAFSVTGKQTEPNIILYNLAIMYNKQPVSNCEYSVYDGRNWSPLAAAKDGKGVAELLGEDSELHKKIGIRVEYEFGDEWKTDKEVNDILSKVEAVPFKKAKIDIAMNKVPDFKPVEDVAPIATNSVAVATLNENAIVTNTSSVAVAAPAKNVLVVDGSGYLPLLKKVETAIGTKNYVSARECFTPEGYAVFQQLIQYGKAVIVAKADYAFMQFDDGVLARSLPMRFSFSNRRTFVENVVFDIDVAAGKIRSLSFALADKACKEILSHDKWTEYSRVSIINFVENYQTAYAL